MFQQNWFFGIKGTKRVCELSDELNRKYLEVINQKHSVNFKTYAPWMSFENRTDYFIQQLSFVEPRDGHRILKDEHELKILRDGFSDQESLPFVFAGKREGATKIQCSSVDQAFVEETTSAIKFLNELSPVFKSRVSHLLFEIIPTCQLDPAIPLRDGGTGISFHRYRGGLFMGTPGKVSDRAMEYAYNIAHELGHQALFVYQYADTILEETDFLKPAYSPVRKTNRPAIMSFHALAAAAFMSEFCLHVMEQHPDKRQWAQERLSDMLPEYKLALQIISDFKFTKLGYSLWEEFYYSIPTFEKALQ